MKVRLILENDYGYTHENSIEIEVDSVPRVGEQIWIDISELFEKAFAIQNDYDNHVFYCSNIGVSGEDYLTVCQIIHDYTIKDFGVYVILVSNYEYYLKNLYEEYSMSFNDYLNTKQNK